MGLEGYEVRGIGGFGPGAFPRTKWFQHVNVLLADSTRIRQDAPMAIRA